MVENKRYVSKGKYIAAFIVTVSIFVIGLFIGLEFSDYTTSQFQREQDLLKIQLTSVDIKNELIGKTDFCSLELESLLKDKVSLGERIEALEISQGKDDPDVLIQKEFYQLVQIKTWLLLRDLKISCSNINQNIILFFYTNKEDKDGRDKMSQTQGFLLNELYYNYPESIAIFSFDINTDNTALETLKEIYGVKEAPTVIINEKLYSGFKSSEEVKILLGLNNK